MILINYKLLIQMHLKSWKQMWPIPVVNLVDSSIQVFSPSKKEKLKGMDTTECKIPFRFS